MAPQPNHQDRLGYSEDHNTKNADTQHDETQKKPLPRHSHGPLRLPLAIPRNSAGRASARTAQKSSQVAEARLHQAGTDALANGRLNQQLSWEICREYTTQQREIPELAIRFGVPPATIRSVLRGKTWAKQTQDTRPDVLRDEPHRTRRQVERPPTITVTRLKEEMGWTDELIEQHSGEEDVRLRNPHYSTSAPMRLYRLDRVVATAEEVPGLRQKLTANSGRRKALSTISEKIAKLA